MLVHRFRLISLPIEQSARLQLFPSSASNFPLSRLGDMFRKYEEHLKENIRNVILAREKDDLEKNVSELMKQIQYCLQPAVRSNITVFNLSTDSNFSETILRSICQCECADDCEEGVFQLKIVSLFLARRKFSKRKMNDRENEKDKQVTAKSSRRRNVEEQHRNRIEEKEDRAERTRLLQLAMDWDCVDVAKEFIFQSSLDNILVGRGNLHTQFILLFFVLQNKNEMFLLALQKNLPLFVYEFLKLKIDYREIFFRKSDSQNGLQYGFFIEELYTPEAVVDPASHCLWKQIDLSDF